MAGKLRVLHLEDEDGLVYHLSNWYARKGVEAAQVRNVTDGLKALEKGPYDVLVVDLMAPEGSYQGRRVSPLEFLKLAEERNPHAHKIIYSGIEEGGFTGVELITKDKPQNLDVFKAAILREKTGLPERRELDRKRRSRAEERAKIGRPRVLHLDKPSPELREKFTQLYGRGGVDATYIDSVGEAVSAIKKVRPGDYDVYILELGQEPATISGETYYGLRLLEMIKERDPDATIYVWAETMPQTHLLTGKPEKRVKKALEGVKTLLWLSMALGGEDADETFLDVIYNEKKARDGREESGEGRPTIDLRQWMRPLVHVDPVTGKRETLRLITEVAAYPGDQWVRDRAVLEAKMMGQGWRPNTTEKAERRLESHVESGEDPFRTIDSDTILGIGDDSLKEALRSLRARKRRV